MNVCQGAVQALKRQGERKAMVIKNIREKKVIWKDNLIKYVRSLSREDQEEVETWLENHTERCYVVLSGVKDYYEFAMLTTASANVKNRANAMKARIQKLARMTETRVEMEFFQEEDYKEGNGTLEMLFYSNDLEGIEHMIVLDAKRSMISAGVEDENYTGTYEKRKILKMFKDGKNCTVILEGGDEH